MLILSQEKSLKKIAKDWDRLYELTPEVSPFLNPIATKIAVKYFYPYYVARNCRPSFCVFSENGVVRAIAPMLRYSSGKMQLWGDVNGFNESGMVYDSETILPECIYILKQHFKDIEFVKIDERSPLAKFAKDHVRKTSNVLIKFPKEFDDYIALLSKSVRQNIRTAYNRLKADGHDIRLDVYSGGVDNLPVSEIIDLYCDRHNDRYGVKTGLLRKLFLKSQSFATRYYRYSPNAITFILRVDGQLAAFMSGLSVKNRFVVPHLSIDNRVKRYSPGVLLIIETIKYLEHNTDIDVLDLSQGEEDYKYKLGGQEHLSYRFTL